MSILSLPNMVRRYLVENSIAIPQGQPGCIDCLELFAPHVRSWITNSQETLCATCRSLEATTELSSMAATATQVGVPVVIVLCCSVVLPD